MARQNFYTLNYQVQRQTAGNPTIWYRVISRLNWIPLISCPLSPAVGFTKINNALMATINFW